VLSNYHIGRFVLSSLCVGDLVRLGLSSARVAGCASACNAGTTQVVLQPATRTLLQPSRTKSPTHNELRTKRQMW
jgi:hypothetical protein